MLYLAVIDIPSVFSISASKDDVRGWGNRVFELENKNEIFSFIFESEKNDVFPPTKINFLEEIINGN